MSSRSAESTTDQIGRSVMRWQDATEDFDEAFGHVHRLSSAERRCLGLVTFEPQSARAIAAGTRLTPASVTALLDRLEERGLLVRTPDPHDRRRVLVSATPETIALADEAYGPIQRDGSALLDSYTATERATILRFLGDAITLQENATQAFLDRHRP